jgi:hypothetical protein
MKTSYKVQAMSNNCTFVCEAFPSSFCGSASSSEARINTGRYLAMYMSQSVILGLSGNMRQPFIPSTQLALIDSIHASSLGVSSSWRHKQSLPNRQGAGVIHVSKHKPRSNVSTDPYLEGFSLRSLPVLESIYFVASLRSRTVGGGFLNALLFFSLREM